MKNIPIFLSSDNNYAPYAAAAIASVCDNTKSFVDFYILDSGISDENKAKIGKLKEQFPNFSVEYIQADTEKLFAEIEYKNQSQYISMATYNRFLIPYIKPELEKVIYLDVDLVVTLDIAELYNIDLSGYAIAAVYDTWCNKQPNHKTLFKDNHDYFNAGVLLIDNKKWKEENIFQKVLETEKTHRNSITFADQDILNLLYDGNNYKQIDRKYNIANFVDVTDESRFICHWAGYIKPWHINPCIKDDSRNPMSRNQTLFWKYAQKTEFYEELLSKTKYNDDSCLRKFLVYELIRRKAFGEKENNKEPECV